MTMTSYPLVSPFSFGMPGVFELYQTRIDELEEKLAMMSKAFDDYQALRAEDEKNYNALAARAKSLEAQLADATDGYRDEDAP